MPFVLSSLGVQGQWSTGIYTGLNNAKFACKKPDSVKFSRQLGYQFGLLGNYRISKDVSVEAQVGIHFDHSGLQLPDSVLRDDTTILEMADTAVVIFIYRNVPLMIKIHNEVKDPRINQKTLFISAFGSLLGACVINKTCDEKFKGIWDRENLFLEKI